MWRRGREEIHLQHLNEVSGTDKVPPGDIAQKKKARTSACGQDRTSGIDKVPPGDIAQKKKAQTSACGQDRTSGIDKVCYAHERLPFRWVERTQQQGCWHVGCCRLVEFPLVVAGCKMVYQGDITTHLMEWHDYCTLKVKSAPSMPYYLLYTRLLKSCIKPCGLIFLVTNRTPGKLNLIRPYTSALKPK